MLEGEGVPVFELMLFIGGVTILEGVVILLVGVPMFGGVATFEDCGTDMSN